jgi:hypothetical protein
MYSEFEGKALLDSYFINRSEHIKFLRNECLSIDSEFIDEKLANFSFNQLLNKHDFFSRETNASVSYVNNDGTIDTKKLLHFILSNALKGIKNYFDQLEWVVKKFEISKKVYANYSPDFKLGKLGYSDHELYLILWCILLFEFLERNKFNYLSTALKLSDLLISLGSQLNVSNEGKLLIIQLLKIETSVVMKLTQE